MSVPDPRTEARLATEREPGNFIAWLLLAEAELDAGAVRAGEAAVQRALALKPGHPEALARLGRALWMQQRHAEAADQLRRAANAAPGHAGIALWLGHVLEDAGEAEAAAEAYAQAHVLAPGEARIAAYLLAWRRKLCDWRGLDALAQQVRAALRDGTASVEPFAFLSEDASASEQLQCARLRAAGIARTARPLPESLAAPSGTAIRLGFLSNGFGAHPTGLLVVAFLEALAHDGSVETHLFALDADDGSGIRRRLQRATHALHDASGLGHAEIARAIRQAGIEVLFDLRGWGGGGVPAVLAMRPAPVQVNWLAYPGTSGAPWIDYVLADRRVLPDALAPYFSEAVAYLPRCFQPCDTARELPALSSRDRYGLPATGTIFCCFNNSYKLNPRSMARHFAVLREVPDSVLWLLSGPGRADERLRAAATAAGVHASRLLFMPKQPHPEYLARLRHADLFLDTNPYNAHTTASDALWAGCPVLTVPGDTFASRVAGSLNHHLGMAEMNMADDAAFVRHAVELGRDPAALAALRTRLAGLRGTASLFDMRGFAIDFAAMASRMVERHRRGLAPATLG